MNAHRRPEGEAAAVIARYARRPSGGDDPRYRMTQPDVWQTLQERQRAILKLLVARGHADPSPLRVLEVGCGVGSNLLELLRIGFAPEHLTGIDLLPDRLADAARRLPVTVQLMAGDAISSALPELREGGFDIVWQSTVFSSILDASARQALARRMWQWVAPGGGVLWYDFTVDNPRNPDVRGVPQAEAFALFPEGADRHWQRLTLAPPLARRACALSPGLYPVLNALPLLRTHALGWFGKGGGPNP